MTHIIKKEKKLWIPLHVHSEYSAYDGAIRIADYKAYAERNELPAAAITDHFTMSSFPEFDKQFSGSNIKRIYGNELYSGTLFGNPNPSMAVPGRKKFHLNAFAMNKKGLINLQKLAAHGFKTYQGEAKGPYFITREGLEEYHKDIIFSSACISGELSVLLAAGKETEAIEWLRQIQSIVGKDNFYIEILDINYKKQDEMNHKLFDFARKNNVKTILTTDSHYMKGGASWYNYLLAAQKRKGDSSSDELNPEQKKLVDITSVMDLSLRDPEDIWEKCGSTYSEAIEETVRLAKRCEEFSVKGDDYMMPHKDFGEGLSFTEEARAGLQKRLDEAGITNNEEYKERLERELTIIQNMGFVDYFRFVSRLVNKCRRAGIYVGPGRGSAAGSVLTWSLGITNLDPLNFGLLFERFLNPERVSMPDIDIDFEDERRGDVIKMLKEDYGEQNVVAITNYSRCKWKVAIRDVMRIMKGEGQRDKYSPWQSDAFVKLLEDKIDTGFDADTDEKNIENSDKNVTASDLIGCIRGKTRQLKALNMELSDAEKILEIAGHFNNLIRSYGKHASGIVICPGPAQEYMPLGRVNGAVVTQYDMKGVDYRKLVKVDILGLSTLSMIREMETAVNRISPKNPAPTISDFMTLINKYGKTPKVELEGYKKQLEDIHEAFTPNSIAAAYKVFCEARTTGVFQFASAGMRKLLRKILPENMEDLSSAVALFRPGPLMSGIAEQFTQGCIKGRAQKQGRSYSPPNTNKPESPVKKLPYEAQEIIKNIAQDAKGEMIYQEHIMAVARAIAGYSLGEADILRKAMGKKDKNLMAEERKKFIAKAKDQGWKESDSSAVFDAIEYFAGYGFNKSHSFCYASLAFITAWYAANRPAVFWAALINDTAKKSSKDSAGHVTISPIIREARNTVPVYPPAMPVNGLSLDELKEINITKAQYNLPGVEVDWSKPNYFKVFLGLSSIKGTSGSLTGLTRLASLNISPKDTIEDVFLKAINNGDGVTLGQASSYFRNGFFDVILLNTIHRYKIEDLLPVYVRLAIIELADTEHIDKDLRDKMAEATGTLIKGTLKEGHIFPFKIVASRCVWGSFLSDAAERLRKKMGYKRGAWTEDEVKQWSRDNLRPVIAALFKRAKKIKETMKEDVPFRIQKYLEIYRLEKQAYGESFTVPDWAVGAEMTGYTSLFYPDMAQEVRWAAIKTKKDEVQSISSEELGKDAAPDIIIEQTPIDYLMDKNKGVWVLGQFGRARWNGDDKGGYISLEGRYGQKTTPLYVSVKQKLPLITLDNMKKVSGQGGIVALRVWCDEKLRFHLCDSSTNNVPVEFKADLEGLPDSIIVLPMMGAAKYQFPLLLPYDREKPTMFKPLLRVADEKNKDILDRAINIYKDAISKEISLGDIKIEEYRLIAKF